MHILDLIESFVSHGIVEQYRKELQFDMALELLPKSMLKAIDLLPDANAPVTLFTRHSIREVVNGQGLSGYDLQLTSEGRWRKLGVHILLIIPTALFSIVFRVRFSVVWIPLL